MALCAWRWALGIGRWALEYGPWILKFNWYSGFVFCPKDPFGVACRVWQELAYNHSVRQSVCQSVNQSLNGVIVGEWTLVGS